MKRDVKMNAKAIELAQLLSTITKGEYDKTYNDICETVFTTLKSGNKVFICGNGGSHAIALHIATEFTGRFIENKPALPVIALGEASHLTCVGNDYGFDFIFSRQLEALGSKNDLLIAMSTSGKSKNVIEALSTAKVKDMKTIALLGKGGGTCRWIGDLHFTVPSENTARIQEIHQFLLHSVTEDVLKNL